MGIVDKIELENHHIAEEMVEHLILEKIGALPDHGHAKAIRLKSRVRAKPKKTLLHAHANTESNFWFYAISLTTIITELWLIGEHLISEYPSLKTLFQ